MRKLFYGGNIITVTEPLYAEAVMVEDGYIVAVGSEEQLREAYSDYEEVNLCGKTMLPGFIDCHSHFHSITVLSYQCSIYGLDTIEKIKAAIDKFILDKGKKPGDWIFVRDYDENIMPGRKNPTREQMDWICKDYPVLFNHRSGHSCVFNSLGMETVGMTEDIPDVEAGEIGRDENGRLNGYVSEAAYSKYRGKVPGFNPDYGDEMFDFAFNYYASHGITTAQEGCTWLYQAKIYYERAEQNKFPIDVVMFPPEKTYQKVKEFLEGKPQYSRLKLGGIKAYIDGSPQLRTALVRTPYLGEPISYGIQTKTDDYIREMFTLAGEENAQILIHANGDGAVQKFLDILEEVKASYPNLKDLRPVVIHGQLTGLDQLPRIRDNGAIVSFFVAHTYHFADAHLRNLGYDRAKNISPTASALENGVPFTFHQDAPVVRADMMETIWCAVNRISREGTVLRGQEISPLDAIKAVTINAAYQYFQEDVKGTIERGKMADFVVLNDNPLTCNPSAIRDIEVLATYKEGDCVYKR